MTSSGAATRRASIVAELKHGWPALIAGLAGVTGGAAAIYFYSTGLFINSLQAEFGWSRSALSWVATIGSLALTVMAPAIGFLVDRFGIRRVALISMLAFSAGFYLLGFLQGPFLLFLAAMALTVVAGSGTSPVTYSRLINLWFDKARGLALGFVLAGTGIAGTLLPPLAGPFIAHHGWRAGYHLLAVLVLLPLPLVAILGAAPRKPAGTAETAAARPGFTLAQSARTRTFWTIGFFLIFASISVAGIIVHFVPMLRDAGLSPERAGALAGLIGIAVIFGRVASGALIDRIFAPYVGVTIMGLAACGCFVLALAGIQYAYVAAILVGTAIGAEVDLVGYLTARYFGLGHYGTVFGWLYAFFMSGTIVGPLIAGALADHFGNYTVALMVFGTSLLISVALALTLPPFPLWEDSAQMK